MTGRISIRTCPTTDHTHLSGPFDEGQQIALQANFDNGAR